MAASTEEIVVVGAGPVGLTAAVALSRAGLPVRVLEAAPDLPDDLRASTFHPPTLDLLERFRIVDDLIAEGLVAPTWQFRDRETGPVATFDLGLIDGDTGHPYRLQCEQWRLTRRLKGMLDAAGVPVAFGCPVTDVAQDGDGVTATLGGGREGETVRAAYLVAADGAHSPVRKAVGVPFEGFTYPELFLVASTPHPFERDLDGLAHINYIADPDEWLALLRVRDFWRVLIPVPVEGDPKAILADDAIEAALQRVAKRAGRYEVAHRTLYNVHQRVAASFRRGRVLLAGDAAHINNPLGGMGMNGGLHDAFNLADKLARLYAGEGEELLDRYDRQRRTVSVEAVQQQTIRNHKLLSERDPAVRAASLDELRRTAADPKLARDYLLRSSMIASLQRAEAIP